MVQRPINQSRPLFLSSYNGKGKTREGPFFKVQSGRITVCNVNQSFTISCYYFRIPSSKCLKILKRDFLQMGPTASGPDLARTQSTTAQNDFTLHIMHLCLLGNLTWHLILVTSLFCAYCYMLLPAKVHLIKSCGELLQENQYWRKHNLKYRLVHIPLHISADGCILWQA